MITLWLYSIVTWLFWPFFHLLLIRRRLIQKELPFRVRERRGIATKRRANAPLIWFHGASIGETLSILPLVQLLLSSYPKAEALITSGTIASANLIETRLPERAQHQFLPLDHPVWVQRFLDSWRPDVGVWAESEVWPNLLQQCKLRGVPIHLVNGRLSDLSFSRWQQFNSMARQLFSVFDSVLAQSARDQHRFQQLGADRTVTAGNIKFAGDPLPASKTEIDGWQAAFLDRPVWFAANTHPGEEEVILDVHERLKSQHPSLITVIAPRHVERVPDIQSTLLTNRTHALYSEGPDMIAAHSILLVDQLGVLGPLYRTVEVALVAGSLVPGIGGHNPIEPARNGSSVLVGAHMESQLDLVDLFAQHDALVQISDPNSLYDVVDLLLSDHGRRQELISRAKLLVDSQADVLRLYSSALLPKVSEIIGEASI